MSDFYKYTVIAKEGVQGIQDLGNRTSINDAGRVALTGDLDTSVFGKNAVFSGDDLTSLKNIAPASVLSNRRFGTAVEINNTGEVIASFRQTNGMSSIRLFDSNSTDSYETIATGGGFLSDFFATFIASVNNSGESVFTAIDKTFTDDLLVTASKPLVLPSTVNLATLRPMIADTDDVVVKYGNQTNSPILLFDNDLNVIDTIASSSNFTEIGQSPGISDDGQIVAFYGEDNDGAGIFAWSDGETKRIAGISGNGILDPGETYEDNNGNGIFDSGDIDVGLFKSFDPNSRVGVSFDLKSPGPLKDEGIGTVTYIATDINDKEGLYTSSFGLADVISLNPEFEVFAPNAIAKVGDEISGLGEIKDLNIYDPINKSGQVAFWADTDSGEAVIKASSLLRPIVILPGIVGSYIANNQTQRDWLGQRGLAPQQLQVDPIANVYDGLIKSLENAGYRQGENLFVANYDWRLPPGPIDDVIDGDIDKISSTNITDNKFQYGVDYLGVALKQAAEKWKQNNPGATPLESVDIIGHSTGGLVARTYIQSNAYGDSFGNQGLELPKVENFVMLGVPNRGASKAWNPLHDNWIENAAYQYVFARFVNLAYQKVLAGETIQGLVDPTWEHLGNITQDTIRDPNTQPPNPLEFIRQYVPTIRTLLATYDFLDRQDGNGLVNVNSNQDKTDPDTRNSLLLDLNAGLDLFTNPVDSNTFINEVGKAIVIYGDGENTAQTVRQQVGEQNLFFDEISRFTDTNPREPEDDEVWYEDINGTNNGDGTVPTMSSAGQFINDSRSNLILQDFDDVTHTSMVSDHDVQKFIFEQLGIVIPENQIVADTESTQFSNLVTALFDPVEAFIIDANGNRLGYSQETGVLTEIPNSVYFGKEDGIGWIFGSVDGPLSLELTGLGEDYYVQVAFQQDGEAGGFESSGFLEDGEERNFTIEIEDIGNTNTAPDAVNDSTTTNEDTAIEIDVLSNDTDADNNPLTLSINETPTNGTATLNDNGTPTDPTDDTITYTPNSNFNGTDSFTYTVNDGTDTTNATVDITVNPVNDLPVATNDTAETNEDQPLTILPSDLLSNDSDVDGDELTITEVSNSANGTVQLGADGNILFTPDSDFNGLASFEYTVSDGTENTSATVAVTVNPVNDLPVATNDTVETNEDQLLTIFPSDLLSNDSDIDGDRLTITQVNNSEGGTVELSEDGNILFTPDSNFNGLASIEYTVSDGTDTTSATVEITVNQNRDRNIIEGTTQRDSLTGTDSNDIITGFQGVDRITTGDGQDKIIYTSIVDAGDLITDFDPLNDIIDLQGVLQSIGFDGSNAIDDGYVQLVSYGSRGTSLQIDADGTDGSAIFRPYLFLQGVSVAEINDNSNLTFG